MTAAEEVKSNTYGLAWEDSMRLPNATYPKHYDLYVHPDLTTKTFTGSVTITINSTEPRDYFLVHTKLLNITETTLTFVDGGNRTSINIVQAFEYAPNEFWVVQTPLVNPGVYELQLTFNGSLSGKIVGFYYSEYKDANGEFRSLATTKFQPTYARQAFPCFDEPSFKSTFNLTVIRPSLDYFALSNMPVQNETPDSPSNGLTEVTFQTSVPMVTYLVCFIVCDFTYLEKILPSGLPFRVYSQQDQVSGMQYALDFGSSVLQFYEGMFQIPFPLPKSDMAAIPDYSSGATEHWGIITFRETNLFYDSQLSSQSNLQRVSAVVAHEFAHQWFGNLVTLLWWDDLWLNEGFASYVEYIGVNNQHPLWDMFSQFVYDTLQDVFVVDSKLSSHPIVQVVETPDQINAMFNDISYSKGASVTRMLEDFLTPNIFWSGITSFLNKYAYGNAVTQDLWDELTLVWQNSVPEGDKDDVGVIMDTWTRQMGYPVVTVTRISPDKLQFRQDRFLQDPSAVSDPAESPYGYKWDIPLSFITSTNSSSQRLWLYREMDQLNATVDPSSTWFKVNLEQKGFYRVNYEPDVWAQLQALCFSLTLSPADRSSLYDDILALADGALLDYDIALNFTWSLISENHYVPWSSASRRLKVMDYLLLETNITTSFKGYTAELVTSIYNSLGWQDSGTHLQQYLRSTIVDVASRSNVDASLSEAGNLLQAWIDDPLYQLPLQTKRQVYWWGMIRSGSNDTWDVMWTRCMNETVASQRSNLYYGLSNSQDPATLLHYITLAQDERNVKMQDFITIIEYISLNPVGMDIAWDWVRANWEWLVDRYTLNDRYLGQMIPYITQYFATVERLLEMEQFFLQYPDAGAGEMYREQALETVKANIRWVNSNAPIIESWLNGRQATT